MIEKIGGFYWAEAPSVQDVVNVIEAAGISAWMVGIIDVLPDNNTLCAIHYDAPGRFRGYTIRDTFPIAGLWLPVCDAGWVWLKLLHSHRFERLSCGDLIVTGWDNLDEVRSELND